MIIYPDTRLEILFNSLEIISLLNKMKRERIKGNIAILFDLLFIFKWF